MNTRDKFEDKVHSIGSLLGQWEEEGWWAASLEWGAYLRPLSGKMS